MATLLAAGLLAAAGCGEDEEQQGAAPEQGGQSTSPARGETGTVSLTDFAIDPANPKVQAGKVTFEVENDGSAPHALEIEGGGTEVKTEVLEGGQSATLEADLAAGEYEWYCPVGDHAAKGMKGTLIVEGEGGGSGESSGGPGGY
jgi:plastocyanin